METLPKIASHYADRISTEVVERTGGCFDISLVVDGLSVGCIRLLSEKPFMVYRGVGDEPMAMASDGSLVPLPL